MSRMRAFQAAFVVAVTSEGPWIFYSATLLLFFPLRYPTDDCPFLIFSYTFLTPCLGNVGRCFGFRQQVDLRQDTAVYLYRRSSR